MKAKYPLLLLLVALALAGCNSKPPGDGPTENGTVSMNLFKEGKGVWFSDETKTLFGLEIAEVAEKPLQRRLETTAQVYRGAHEGSPARALILLSDDEAKELKIGQLVSLKTAKGEGPEATGKLVQLDTQAHAALGQIRQFQVFQEQIDELVTREGKAEVVLAIAVRTAFRPAPSAAALWPWDGVAFDVLLVARQQMIAQAAGRTAVQGGLVHPLRRQRDLASLISVLDAAAGRAFVHRLADKRLGSAHEPLPIGEVLAAGI